LTHKDGKHMLNGKETEMTARCSNHPDKPVMAKGLCAACYMRQHRAKKSTYVGRRPNGANYDVALAAKADWVDRFYAKIDRGGDCHVWTGQKTNAGYGVFYVANMTLLAHRLMRAMDGGNLLAPVVMHACDNPSCVNPAHLQDGTYADNMADMDAKGRRNVTEKSGAHLKDRQNHPKARRVMTPIGEFASASLAADALGISKRYAQRLAGDCRNGWKWLD
jgi:hypothetical protein